MVHVACFAYFYSIVWAVYLIEKMTKFLTYKKDNLLSSSFLFHIFKMHCVIVSQITLYTIHRLHLLSLSVASVPAVFLSGLWSTFLTDSWYIKVLDCQLTGSSLWMNMSLVSSQYSNTAAVVQRKVCWLLPHYAQVQGLWLLWIRAEFSL